MEFYHPSFWSDWDSSRKKWPVCAAHPFVSLCKNFFSSGGRWMNRSSPHPPEQKNPLADRHQCAHPRSPDYMRCSANTKLIQNWVVKPFFTDHFLQITQITVVHTLFKTFLKLALQIKDHLDDECQIWYLLLMIRIS